MSKDNIGSTGLPGLSDWVDPLEQAFRSGVRSYLQELLEQEVSTALGRLRHGREAAAHGYRNGHRERTLIGTFGKVTLAVPRARVLDPAGGSQEFRSGLLPRYKRLTPGAVSLIGSAYLAGVNTRRVRRALVSLFGGAVSKDTVSRAWRTVQTDFSAWNRRSLADEPMVRLILDGTVVRVRLDRKATSLSILVAMGVRADGQKVLLGLKALAGESAEAWRELLDDMAARGLCAPQLLIIDGGKGLETALAALWPTVPVQRCTVHKHRNLLAHGWPSLSDKPIPLDLAA